MSGASQRHKCEIHEFTVISGPGYPERCTAAPVFNDLGEFPSEINFPNDGVTPMTPVPMSKYFEDGGTPTTWVLTDAPSWLYIDSSGVLRGTAPDGAGDVQIGTFVTASNPVGSDDTNQFDLVTP